MTENEAHDTFTDITTFDAPMDNIEQAARFTDEDAGIVFWAFEHQNTLNGSSNQFEVVSKQLYETNLGK